MKNSFKKYLFIDLKFGVTSNIIKYIILLVLFFYLSFECIQSVTDTIGFETNNLTITDLWFYIFQGITVYNPSSKLPFIIPLDWLFIQILAGLIILNYPNRDLYTFGIQSLMRIKKRSYWWVSKCLWNVLSVILIYFIAFLCVCTCSIIFGRVSLSFNSDYFDMMITSNINMVELVFVFYFLPITTTVALSMLQMLVSVITKPIYSFILIICYYVISIYYCVPFLIGDKSMLIRLSFFELGKTNYNLTLFMNLFFIVGTYIIGLLYFNKKDLLRKG